MSDRLRFDAKQYTIETVERDGHTLVYRAFEDIVYVENPVDPIQRLSIYVPEVYYKAGGKIGKYAIGTAPIFMPSTVGGYMPGPVERPGVNFMGETNGTFWALLHGYVVVSAGVRGRGMKDKNGAYVGMAPAGICDWKAAVRYLRHNKDLVPGDVEKVVSNGTSAGGAMSSLLGGTGNHPDYEAYLTKMGAAKESDQIYAASCYCPITNLDHADMAYEWEFQGIHEYHRVRFEEGEGGGNPHRIPVDGTMTEAQILLSDQLKSLFPEYLNGLTLRDREGNVLSLNADGRGTFLEYLISYVPDSVRKETERGTDLSDVNWFAVENGDEIRIDFDQYVKYRTRMKETPAFDSVSMGTPENELFGSAAVLERHFTRFSYERSLVKGELAEDGQVKMMNPMNYIDDERAEKARYYRIRHGAVDRDTSLAIPAMLAAKLENQGIAVDLAFPWGIAHAGDYDLDELFSWIDHLQEPETYSN